VALDLLTDHPPPLPDRLAASVTRSRWSGAPSFCDDAARPAQPEAVMGGCAPTSFRVGVSSATFSHLGDLEADPPSVLRRRMVTSHHGEGPLRPLHSDHPQVPAPGTKIPPRGRSLDELITQAPTALVESPLSRATYFTARRVREATRGNGPAERPAPRLGPTSQSRAVWAQGAPARSSAAVQA
jgi:hypothetical protein